MDNLTYEDLIKLGPCHIYCQANCDSRLAICDKRLAGSINYVEVGIPIIITIKDVGL